MSGWSRPVRMRAAVRSAAWRDARLCGKFNAQGGTTLIDRLVNIGIVLALMLGGGGGALAAAVCPHADCAASARANEPAQGDHQSHAPAADEGHRHGAAADAPTAAAAHESQSSLLDSHEGSCVGRTSTPPAAEKARRPGAPKRGDDGVAHATPARPVDASSARVAR